MPISIHRFAGCSVDPAARELRRDGELVTLSPKVFDCLAYLIEHRERAVGRDELIAAVWGRTDVSDTLLGQTVLKARRAVGDIGNEQRMIRTVPRFGYRWVAPLQPEPDAAPDPLEPDSRQDVATEEGIEESPASPEPVPDSSAPLLLETPVASLPPSRQRPAMGALRVAVVLAVVVALVVLFSGRSNPPATPTASKVESGAPAAPVATEERIAVLPLHVVAEPDWAWLRLGLMDLVANRLHNAGQPVVPSDNVVALTRNAVDEEAGIRELRAVTGARYVIVSRAERSGGGWQVRLSLREADGRHRDVSAENADAVAAASEASDRLLVLLGLTPATGHDAALSLTELQQRTEAALLSDDFPTALRLIEAAPPALREAPQIRLRLAQIEFRSGRMKTAREGLQTLLAQVPAEVDPVLRARIFNGLGAVAIREERSADAQAAFSEAVALVESRNQPSILGQAYTGLGAAHASRGQYDIGSADLSRARVALELAGDTLALGRVEANEGILDNVRGRFAVALPSLQRAATRFEQFGALGEWFLTVGAEIDAHLALLQPDEALASSEAAFAQQGHLDNPHNRDWMRLQRVQALAAVGRGSEAKSLLAQLRDDNDHRRDPLGVRIAAVKAHLAVLDGRMVDAVAPASVAVAGLPGPDVARQRAQAWLDLVRGLLGSDQPARAVAESQRFAQWSARSPGSPAAPILAALAQAEVAWAQGGREAALQNYADAFGQAERWAVPADLRTVAESYAGALIGSGQTERASVIAGRVARWAERDFSCALLLARLYRALGQRDAWQLALSRAEGLAGERSIPAWARTPPGEMRASPPSESRRY